MTKLDKKRLLKQIEKGQLARQALNEIEHKETRQRHLSLVNKCYRFRNSYSCPEGPADYWWLYAKVTSVDEDGRLVMLTFQTDKYGETTLTANTHVFTLYDGYVEIESKLWNQAWNKAMDLFE